MWAILCSLCVCANLVIEWDLLLLDKIFLPIDHTVISVIDNTLLEGNQFHTWWPELLVTQCGRCQCELQMWEASFVRNASYYLTYIGEVLFFVSIHVWLKGCPKIKLALGKRLEIATHGFKIFTLNVKRDKLGPNPSGPLLGHPWMHSISLEPFWNPPVFPGVRITNNCQIS